jgi:glycosyltransferase involved in cell wall biosynthesis
VALVGPVYPYRGGIAHYTAMLARALAEKHETLVVSFRRQYPAWLYPGKSDKDPSKQPLRTPAEYLLDPLYPWTWWRTAHRIREFGARAVVMPWWVPFWAPSFATLARMAGGQGGPRIIFVCHNVMPHDNGLLDTLLTRLALSQGDGFVIQSRSDGSRLAQLVPQGRSVYVPLPVPPARATGPILARCSDDEGESQLLFFGIVRPYKGLGLLLEALPMVRERRRVHLTVAGEFWDQRERYVRKINDLGLGDLVTVEDHYVPDEELAGLFQRADLLTLPYLSATASAVLAQAMAHGVPVVVTEVGDLGDIVRAHGIGTVAAPGDPRSLADAILAALEPSTMAQLRQNVQVMTQGSHQGWSALVAAIETLAA